MKVSLVVNFEKKDAKKIANEVIDKLHKANVKILCDEDTAKNFSSNVAACENHITDADFCIVIGGDGTIIHTAKKAAILNKAVLGINVGRIGYLASLNQNELDEINKVLLGEYDIEERMMLDVVIESNNELKTFTAFNDAVITKGTLSRMLDMKVCIDEHEIPYRSDGLIISTPTGSTAYSLSAGGPVVDPRVEDIIITPICPYSCFNRPMIVPYMSKINASVDVVDGKEAYLTVDGEVAIKINEGDCIKISRSDISVKLISLKTKPAYFSLGTKLK